MRKLYVAIAIFGVFILLSPNSTYAHVFVKESKGKMGAVLHINPDDDPVVGQESNLFYDIQDPNLDTGNFTSNLVIIDNNDVAKEVATSRGKNTVSANYTFPAAGVYRINLYIVQSSGVTNYEYTQRVSRGESGNIVDNSSKKIAKFMVISSATLFGLIIIVVVNRRQEILKQSKW